MFINIGNENYVESTRILGITIVGSSPIRKLMQNTQEKNQLIDLTCGKKTRSLIIMDTGVIFQSSVGASTIAERSNYYKTHNMSNEHYNSGNSNNAEYSNNSYRSSKHYNNNKYKNINKSKTKNKNRRKSKRRI